MSEARLRSAVSAAGDATPAVRQYLCGQAGPAEAANAGPWTSAPRTGQIQRQQA